MVFCGAGTSWHQSGARARAVSRVYIRVCTRPCLHARRTALAAALASRTPANSSSRSRFCRVSFFPLYQLLLPRAAVQAASRRARAFKYSRTRAGFLLSRLFSSVSGNIVCLFQFKNRRGCSSGILFAAWKGRIAMIHSSLNRDGTRRSSGIFSVSPVLSLDSEDNLERYIRSRTAKSKLLVQAKQEASRPNARKIIPLFPLPIQDIRFQL